MTDLFMRPTWDVVDCSLGPKSRVEPVVRHRAERCRVHCHGQFAVDACPYCRRDSDRTQEQHVSLQLKRDRLVAQAAALEIIRQHQRPSTLVEFSLRIKERCGIVLTQTQVSDLLQSMRQKGLTNFYVKPERARKLAAVEHNP